MEQKDLQARICARNRTRAQKRATNRQRPLRKRVRRREDGTGKGRDPRGAAEEWILEAGHSLPEESLGLQTDGSPSA